MSELRGTAGEDGESVLETGVDHAISRKGRRVSRGAAPTRGGGFTEPRFL